MTTPEIARWQEADQHRDQLQAQLDRLDADPRIDVDDRLREALGDAISDADDECEEAEVAFYRAEGDAEAVARLGVREAGAVHGPDGRAKSHEGPIGAGRLPTSFAPRSSRESRGACT